MTLIQKYSNIGKRFFMSFFSTVLWYILRKPPNNMIQANLTSSNFKMGQLLEFLDSFIDLFTIEIF